MRITLAYPYTDEQGKKHNPDTTLDLPDAKATQLIADGRARTASTTTGKKTSSSKTKES